MKNFEQMTTDEKLIALKAMTIEERVAAMTTFFAKADAKRLNAPSMMNKAPKNGWTDADRIAK